MFSVGILAASARLSRHRRTHHRLQRERREQHERRGQRRNSLRRQQGREYAQRTFPSPTCASRIPEKAKLRGNRVVPGSHEVR